MNSRHSDAYFDPYAVPLQDFTSAPVASYPSLYPSAYEPQQQEYVPPPAEKVPSVPETHTKRCRRCEIYYHPGEEQRCYYHPGLFRTAVRGQWSSIAIHKWTCCKELSPSARPCKVSNSHVECPTTSSALGLLPKQQGNIQPTHKSSATVVPPTREPVQPLGPLQDYRIKVESSFPRDNVSSLSENEPDTEILNGEPMFKHFVDNRDTLFSISARYKVSTQEIEKINRLVGPIYSRYFLWIPDRGQRQGSAENPEAVMKRQILRLRRQCPSMTRQEAIFYLEDAKWNLDQATQAYFADVAWENQKKQIPL